MFKKQLKRLFTISLLAAVTSAISAGEVAGPIEIRAIAMPDATIEQLSRNHVGVSNVARPHEHRRPFAAAPLVSKSITAGLALPAGSAPPPVALTFSASGSQDIYPADASGSVSRLQVVGAFNSGLTVQDRTGKYLQRIPLSSFWRDPALTGDFFDPRVAYDRANDRWVLATLNQTASKVTLLLAISQNGDAAGAWRRFQVPLTPPAGSWDFTRLALTSDRIAVTLNNYDSYDASLFTVLKSDAYDSSTTSLAVTSLNVHSLDVTPVENADPGDARLRFVVMGGGSSVITTDIVGGRQTNITSYQSPVQFNIGDLYLIGRQLGSTKLMDVGPAMVHYAVSRNGTMWVVATVGMPFGGNSRRAAILVWRISAGSAKVNLIDSGSDAISVSYPSIAVNILGGALVAYSLFDPSRYASAAYVYIDPLGNMSAQAFVKDGIAPYELDRWGDYSSTVVDPIDDIGFWTVQVYPTNFGLINKTPNWTTYWSQFTLTPVRRRSAHH
jgi:hypothetical protein